MPGGLDVTEEGVGPLECRGQDGLAAGVGTDDLLRAAGIGDATEAGEAVADDVAAGGYAAACQLLDGLAPETLDPAQLQADRLAVVSTATMIGVLPGEPRPRLPPERSPPR